MLTKNPKKFIAITAIVLLIMIFVIPFVLNCLFKYGTSFDIFVAEWDSGDALSFYGTILSFIGTSVLSILALYQNHCIDKLSKEHSSRIEEMEKERYEPCFYINNFNSTGKLSNISFEIKNISDNIIQNVIVCDVHLINQESTIGDDKFQKAVLYKDNALLIELKNKSIGTKDPVLNFKVQYNTVLGETHQKSVKILLEQDIGKSIFVIEK